MSRCIECAHFNPDVDILVGTVQELNSGECLRYPPKANQEWETAYFPIVEIDMYCGEHKPRGE